MHRVTRPCACACHRARARHTHAHAQPRSRIVRKQARHLQLLHAHDCVHALQCMNPMHALRAPYVACTGARLSNGQRADGPLRQRHHLRPTRAGHARLARRWCGALRCRWLPCTLCVHRDVCAPHANRCAHRGPPCRQQPSSLRATRQLITRCTLRTLASPTHLPATSARPPPRSLRSCHHHIAAAADAGAYALPSCASLVRSGFLLLFVFVSIVMALQPADLNPEATRDTVSVWELLRVAPTLPVHCLLAVSCRLARVARGPSTCVWMGWTPWAL